MHSDSIICSFGFWVGALYSQEQEMLYVTASDEDAVLLVFAYAYLTNVSIAAVKSFMNESSMLVGTAYFTTAKEDWTSPSRPQG